MKTLTDHTALKEWSNVIDALGRGEQVILIRKGGIADPSFGVEAERFYLYPTYFHQPTAAAEPQQVPITHWCEVVRTWRVRELEAVDKLLPFVVMSREALETRYRFRADQALHVIAVRAMRLPKAVTIPVRSAYIGCRSWLSIEDEIDTTASMQAIDESVLQAKIEAIDRELTGG